MPRVRRVFVLFHLPILHTLPLAVGKHVHTRPPQKPPTPASRELGIASRAYVQFTRMNFAIFAYDSNRWAVVGQVLVGCVYVSASHDCTRMQIHRDRHECNGPGLFSGKHISCIAWRPFRSSREGTEWTIWTIIPSSPFDLTQEDGRLIQHKNHKKTVEKYFAIETMVSVPVARKKSRAGWRN